MGDPAGVGPEVCLDLLQDPDISELCIPIIFGDFSPASDPDSVVVDMKDSRVWDHSGLEALHKLGERYQGVGKNLRVRHISKNCQNLLKKAGSLVHIDILPDDPSYHVAQFNMPAKNTLQTNA